MTDENTKSVFEKIDGLTAVDPDQLEEFKRAMNEEVIPEIVRTVEERRLRAAESRLWQLKC